MSYCRFLEADVYVYMDVSGYLSCSACSLLDDRKTFQAYSTQEMVSHLKEHKQQGDRVPTHVFEDLWADDLENFPNGGERRKKEQEEALDELRRMTEELRASDPETFDANQHWINNPLISPISKVHMFAEWEERIRREERERITRVAEQWISEMRGHDGEYDCRHESNVLQQFIEHEEFDANKYRDEK